MYLDSFHVDIEYTECLVLSWQYEGPDGVIADFQEAFTK